MSKSDWGIDIYKDEGVDPDDGYDDNEYGPPCPVCGAEMESEECYACHGDGGYYPGEDNPNEYALDEWEECQECNGKGYYWECPHVPHGESEVK